MATNKQTRMMLARAREAGIKIGWADVEGFENGQVDEFLAKCEKFLADARAVGCKKEAEKKPEINNIRLGLCMKLIIQDSKVEYLIDCPVEFTHRVTDLYKLMTETEEAIKASFLGD